MSAAARPLSPLGVLAALFVLAATLLLAGSTSRRADPAPRASVTGQR